MKGLYPFLMFVAMTLVFHGIWEHLHIGLYTGYQFMEGALPVWMLATLGDLFYALLIIGIVSLVKHDVRWLRNPSIYEYVAAAVLGLLIALLVEYKGLYLGRWHYLPAMPIVPLLKVGLSPVIQMVVLTPLSLFVVRLLSGDSH